MAGGPEESCQNAVWSRSSTPPPPAHQGLHLITPRRCSVHHSRKACYRLSWPRFYFFLLTISPMDCAQTAQVWEGLRWRWAIRRQVLETWEGHGAVRSADEALRKCQHRGAVRKGQGRLRWPGDRLERLAHPATGYMYPTPVNSWPHRYQGQETPLDQYTSPHPIPLKLLSSPCGQSRQGRAPVFTFPFSMAVAFYLWLICSSSGKMLMPRPYPTQLNNTAHGVLDLTCISFPPGGVPAGGTLAG